MDKEMLEQFQSLVQGMAEMEKRITDDIRSVKSDVENINQRTERLETDLQQVNQRTERLEVLLEHDIPHQIKLLAEGHAGILERLPEAEEVDTLRTRICVLERVVTDHTKAIQERKQA